MEYIDWSNRIIVIDEIVDSDSDCHMGSSMSTQYRIIRSNIIFRSQYCDDWLND